MRFIYTVHSHLMKRQLDTHTRTHTHICMHTQTFFFFFFSSFSLGFSPRSHGVKIH